MFDSKSRLSHQFAADLFARLWKNWDAKEIAKWGGRSYLSLPFGIGILCIISLSALWVELFNESEATQEAAIAQAHRDANNLTTVLGENIKRTLGAVDQLMISIIAEQPSNPNSYRIPVWVNITTFPTGLDSHISLAGPDGILRTSTLNRPQSLDLSDRAHFRWHLNPAASQPYIGAPAVCRLTGQLAIQVTRRITRADGSFGGVIVFSIDPNYFERLFDSVDLGGNGIVVLTGRDGIVRARSTTKESDGGPNDTDTQLDQSLNVAGTGSDIVRSHADGLWRVVASSAVPDYPLVVSVGIGLDDVLAVPRRERTTRFTIGGLLSAVVIGLSALLVRATNRRRSHADQLIDLQRRQLNAALNNMSQGLCLFDSSGRLVLCNQRYLDIYGLGRETVRPGCTFRDLLERRKQAGTFAGDPAREAAEVLAGTGREAITSQRIDLSGSRTIEVENVRLPDGGMVSTHNDVSEMRRGAEALSKALSQAELAGQEAHAAHARLRDALEVVPEGVALLDADDRYVLWNQRYAEVYAPTHTAIGLQVGMRFVDALRAAVAQGQILEAIGREEEWLAERLARHASLESVHEQHLQGDRWIRVLERRTADGGSIGVRIDITDLKQREESFRLLFDSHPLPMFVFDLESLRFLAVNDAALAHYGYSREHFLTLTVLDVRPGEDIERFLRRLRAGEIPETEEGVGRHQKSDGTIFEAAIYSRQLLYEGRAARLASIIDITERRRAERERDRNREFLDRIIDNIPITIVVKQAADRKYVLLNQTGEKCWHLTRDQVIGKTADDLFPNEWADLIAARDEQALRSDVPFVIGETKNFMSSDPNRIITAKTFVIREPDGTPQYLVSVVEDISDRRRLELERDRNREFLERLIETIPIMILVKDAGTRRHLLINQAGQRLWQRSSTEVVGKTAYELFPKTAADVLTDRDNDALASDVPIVWGQHPPVGRGDGTRLVTSKTFAIRDGDRTPQYLVTILEDITDRRLTEIERDRNREFLDLVIENVPATILVKEAREQRYVLVNRSCENLWGVPRAQIIGKTAHELFPKESADLITERDRSLLASDASADVAERLIKMPNNTTRLVLTRRFLIRDQFGLPQYLVGVIEDVTERRAFEQQLHQAQKMEAVGNLTGGLAHDFNNLLTIIISNLDLLKDDVVGNDIAGHRVEAILQASLRGADLTGQMLAFSRRQALQPKLVPINQLVSNTTRLLKRTLGADIQIEVRCAADLWPVLVDETQLQTALVNVAINARDAMGDGGQLQIAAYNACVGDAHAAMDPEVKAGDYVVIEVSDTGIGMPPEVLDRIFEPFFTTKDPGQGTGLGLSMVYGFVRQSGGHVSVKSEPGAGTTFKLYLPRAPSSHMSLAAPQSDSARRTVMPLRSEVILAVDDDDDVRRAVVVQLQALGYQVVEAASASAALKILDGGQKVDLLFTDVVMPGMNGKELAILARAKRPALKVLFTSGFPGGPSGAASELDTGDALLSKPYRREHLAKAIHQALQ
jgi:PAS domain S-box-containing protein